MITITQIKEIQRYAEEKLNLKLGFTWNRFNELIIFEIGEQNE
jgi:hypothetical protein